MKNFKQSQADVKTNFREAQQLFLFEIIQFSNSLDEFFSFLIIYFVLFCFCYASHKQQHKFYKWSTISSIHKHYSIFMFFPLKVEHRGQIKVLSSRRAKVMAQCIAMFIGECDTTWLSRRPIKTFFRSTIIWEAALVQIRTSKGGLVAT